MSLFLFLALPVLVAVIGTLLILGALKLYDAHQSKPIPPFNGWDLF